MLAIKMWNQPLNPISYSQLIGWFAWNCGREVIFFIWNSLGSVTYMFSKKQFLSILWSFDLDWGLIGQLNVLQVRGFNTMTQLVLLADATKLFGKSPLQQCEHVKLKNSATNSPKFHAKVSYSAYVTFITRYIK